jgi:hypothetical protein
MILPPRVTAMLEALLGPLGQSDPELRRAVFQQTRTASGTTSALHPNELRELVQKIDRQPWIVSDEDFHKLLQAGYSEDQIFEVTVAASVGAGVRRLEAGLRALETAAGEASSQHPDPAVSDPANQRVRGSHEA